MVPISVKNSFSLFSSLPAFVSFFTATISPLFSSPLYTSAYPPFPTKFSAHPQKKKSSKTHQTLKKNPQKIHQKPRKIKGKKHLKKSHWWQQKFHQKRSISKWVLSQF